VLIAGCASSEKTAETKPAATSPATEPSTVAETTLAPTTVAETAPTEAPDEPQVQAVGFKSTVMPILENNCASCHAPGGPGSAEFPLNTAKDAQEASDYLGALVGSQTMPPWPAGDGDVKFHDDRRLTDDEIASVVAWVKDGATLDVDPATPVVPSRSTVTPIERDIVLKGQPFKGSREESDDNYRCQIYDPQVTETSYIQGMSLEPDRTEVVHHALFFKADADVRAAAEAADAEQEGIGWTCPGLAGFSGDQSKVAQVMTWGPGQAPTVLPEGTGIELQPGDFFVTQIHYHYAPEWDALPADESTIVIDLASKEKIAAAGGALDPITLTLYLAPAEIPCSTEETGPLCDRATAAAQLDESGALLGTLIADSLLQGCGQKVEDFAGMTNGIATSSCDLPVEPGQIVNIWGHEHEIGATFKMTLNPGTPEERVLLDIPRWSFEWQLNYYPIEDIILDDDDIVRVECSWDRSKLPEDAEPRYIVWAEGTTDEMCFSQIVTRPVRSN
jgi:mono/diheme cytochrome c family protein